MAKEVTIQDSEADPQLGQEATSLETTSEVEESLVEPEPAHFEDWGLAQTLMRALADMGYERPMPVQEAVYKTLTDGDDLMVQSMTGSGKTAAFGIPIAQLLSGGKKGVQSLILAPTRELALQVAREIEKLVTHMDVSVVPVYGGAPIGPQIKKLEDGGQIVAGTPGRVLDHIRRKTMDTSGIRILVLDECDEMLSMGFQEEIENIISTLPAKEERQTLLFSATIPKEIERIGRRHMRNPEMVSLSSDSVGADLVDHYYYVVSGMARNRDLLKLMKAEKPDSAIIFCNTREETNTVARYLRTNGYDAEAISSDLSQSDRERVMGRMRDKNLDFLVATDIAARGIDISELSHVINYTFPSSPEVYVHRTGRTGRAGKEGTALSLVGPREIGAFYYLKLIYKIIPAERELPTADEMAAIEEGELYQQVIAMFEGEARKEHIALAKRLWQSNEGERVVALLLQQLLAKKSDKPKPSATPEPASKPARATASDEKQSESERPARKRRRRRGSEEEEQPTVASAPAASPETVGEEKPRRRRRRRGTPETDVAQSEVVTAEATPEVKAAAEVKATPEVKAAAEVEAVAEVEATPEVKAVAEVEAAPEVKAAAEVEATIEAGTEVEAAEEKPKRKRRRRRSRASEEDRDETSATAPKEEEDAGETEKAISTATPKARTKTKEKEKAKAPKREPKPQIDPGSHGEFWEAWADTKQEDESPPEESDAKVVAAKESDKPKRRRRRRGQEDSEASANSESKDSETDAKVPAPGGDVRLFVNVGKREDADVDAIRSFLGDAIGDKAEELGRITLRNTHCYVRVPEEIADELIEACTGLVFAERDVVVERARAKR